MIKMNIYIIFIKIDEQKVSGKQQYSLENGELISDFDES